MLGGYVFLISFMDNSMMASLATNKDGEGKEKIHVQPEIDFRTSG